ncbi:MAG: FkbM family methyltransferase [Armatimonadetes bacterium]|nr:FkbM family methyltransferase [Armatimonadota bacterium]
MANTSDPILPPPPPSFEADDFPHVLESLGPQIGSYDWMWALLRLSTRRRGGFPERLYARLRRLGNPRRPYFRGRTADGTAFLGDYRDFPSAAYMVMPRWNDAIIQFMRGQYDVIQGNYLDLGANFGVVAATMARHLAGRAEVVAVEPIPETARRAAATFALNRLTNVRLVQAAIGDQDSEITFNASPGNSAIASVHRHQFQQLGTWQQTRVPCRTLDTLCSGMAGRIGLIKIDVEGHELQVIRGASALLARDRPSVLFEFTPALSTEYGYQAADVVEQIGAAGTYRCVVLHDSGEMSAFPPPQGWQDQVNVYCVSE